MTTTAEIVQAIRQLSEKERQELLSQIPELLGHSQDKSVPKKGALLMALAGRLDLGECLIPNPDCEMLYGED